MNLEKTLFTYVHEHTQKKYDFKVEHDPHEHNYHHCEIRVYEDDVRMTTGKEPPSMVKKYYRTIMAGPYSGYS